MGGGSKGSQIYDDRRRFDFGWRHTMQYIGAVLQNRVLEPYISLLTNITPVYLINFLK